MTSYDAIRTENRRRSMTSYDAIRTEIRRRARASCDAIRGEQRSCAMTLCSYGVMRIVNRLRGFFFFFLTFSGKETC